MSIRKALGAVKDQTSISIAKVSAAVAPELDVAIVRATSHEDAPAEDRHVREAHSASWDHSAFVRAYADYLDHRARFLISLLPAPRTVRFADERGSSPTPASSVHDMDTEALLGRALQLRQLLDRFLACRPSGGARSSRVVLATLYAVVKESTQLCSDVAVVLAVLLDRFFDMDYPDCVKVFEAHVSTAKQTDELLAFYAWCDDVRLARPADFADVKRIDDKLLETLEQFVRERGRAGQSSPPPWQQQPARSDDPYPDMNGIKALPAPEHHAAEPSRSAAEKVAPVAKRSPEQVAPPQTGDLVDLREPVGDDQENKLALALFSGPPVADGGWVAFPSDDAPEVTSAWQTPAVEPGKADWELALMAEMERKQQLLVQEQQMWAHYRQGGMQGQVAMDRLAAGGGAMPMQMPMQYGMPMASYSGYY
uniref:AP180 N-terminal homology (ANTH) domain-containing protein n=1 Tax=Oryza brachyantha TaxID=4533 RepID=J3M3B5_ORYBR